MRKLASECIGTFHRDVSGHVQHLSVYMAGPALGALLATPVCALVRRPGRCDLSPKEEPQPT
jgi:hypothetical protein